jgi:signal transduction histidine kinase
MTRRSEVSIDPEGRSAGPDEERPAPPRGPGAAIHEAARRVLADGASWQNEALDRSEAERCIEHLCAILQHGTPDHLEREETAAALQLQCRLLDLLRRQLLADDQAIGDDQLIDLVRRIEALSARLEPEDNQTVSTLLTGVSSRDLVVELAHDLRSPLTSVMFLAETLRKGQSGEINDVQRQQLGIIYSASLNLVSVASDLIDLAREGDFVTRELEPEPFSIGEVLESVRAMVAPMAHEKRLHLHFFSPDRDTRLGSSVRLSRVLLNLTANAIKFTETGRVEILAVERGPSRVEFSVRDTGRGMDEKTLETLFLPFRRSESQTGFHFSGTGLGLSICRRLVEVMGGDLQVESRPGYGSRFFFELDLPRASRL